LSALLVAVHSKRPCQVHSSLNEPAAEEKKHFLWENLADTRPGPEEECRNLQLRSYLHKCAGTLVANFAKNAARLDRRFDL